MLKFLIVFKLLVYFNTVLNILKCNIVSYFVGKHSVNRFNNCNYKVFHTLHNTEIKSIVLQEIIIYCKSKTHLQQMEIKIF